MKQLHGIAIGGSVAADVLAVSPFPGRFLWVARRNLDTDVRSGSWLCKNAKTLNRDRRSYSSKTALVVQLASEFNLEVELKNIILVALRFFEFLHSQSQKAKYSPGADVFRFGPESELKTDTAGGPVRATNGHPARFPIARKRGHMASGDTWRFGARVSACTGGECA